MREAIHDVKGSFFDHKNQKAACDVTNSIASVYAALILHGPETHETTRNHRGEAVQFIESGGKSPKNKPNVLEGFDKLRGGWQCRRV